MSFRVGALSCPACHAILFWFYESGCESAVSLSKSDTSFLAGIVRLAFERDEDRVEELKLVQFIIETTLTVLGCQNFSRPGRH